MELVSTGDELTPPAAGQGRHWFLMTITGLLLALLVSASGRSGAEELNVRQRLLSEANGFFRRASQTDDPAQAAGLYQQALIRFEKLVHEGVRNGGLYYDLGNSYFQLHDLGRANLNYRRAQLYLPGDENLRQNLAAARGQQPDRIKPQQEVAVAKTILFWHYDLSARLRLWALVTANACFWAGLGLQLYRRRRPFPWPVALALALSVLLSASLLYEHFDRQRAGVLVAVETTARKGDGQAYAVSFDAPLHAGVEFTLVERRGDWLYIELADGRRCWVETVSAELL